MHTLNIKDARPGSFLGLEKLNTPCPICGGDLCVDNSKILTSIPPKKIVTCLVCGYSDYIEANKKVLGTIVNSVEDTNSSKECNHQYDCKLMSGNIVSYCVKCGKIGEIKTPNFTCM